MQQITKGQGGYNGSQQLHFQDILFLDQKNLGGISDIIKLWVWREGADGSCSLCCCIVQVRHRLLAAQQREQDTAGPQRNHMEK